MLETHAFDPVRPAPIRRALVIHNPAAGQWRQRRFQATLTRLRALGVQVELADTAARGDAEAFGRAVSPHLCDVVVAAGGDGTINEVVNGLMAAPGPVPPLAIIPLGTANVLAAEIGLSTRPAAVAAAIAGGRRALLHPGLANGRHFVMMAGIGFDAHVVENVHLGLKRHTGKLAYVAAMVTQVSRYAFPEFSVTVDDGAAVAARAVVACKGRLYGGPFLAAPHARLDQAGFEAVVMQGHGLGAVARYGLALVAGRLPHLGDVRLITGRKVVVTGPAGSPVQGDGDIVAHLPVEIIPAARPLEILVPE